jgi:lysophospholipase L1-like esterase
MKLSWPNARSFFVRWPRRWGAWGLVGLLALPAALSCAQEAAPVPAPVAIARPSAAEVARAKAALQVLLSQADPATLALAARYPELISVRPPRPNPALIPSLRGNFFLNKHQTNVERAKQGGIDLLFMGDSITDFWRNEGAAGDPNPPRAGRVVFDQYFGRWRTANFGISGVLYRLRHGEGEGFQPKVIMLMIGTNDASSAPFCSAPEIAEGIGAIVLEMRRDFPQAKILLLGIFPRGEPGDATRQTVLAVNPIIARLDDGQHVIYRDIGSIFLQPDGTIAPDIMADRLHPNRKGYVLWAEAVKDTIVRLME